MLIIAFLIPLFLLAVALIPSYMRNRRNMKLLCSVTSPNRGTSSERWLVLTMLKAGERMFAYRFEGYWKDVGTIDSLYEANMDLLGDNPKFNVTDSSWKIQSRSPLAPPHYIGENAKIGNSIIMSGCEINGTIENSVLASNVIVKKGAIVRNSIIMSEYLRKLSQTIR